MTSGSQDPLERAEVIKKLEERWLVKSKENETSQATITAKKSRTSLTNPIIKNKTLNGQPLKTQSS